MNNIYGTDLASNILDRVHLGRRAGRVQRYHTQYLIRPESVAEHTFGLINIIMVMTGRQVTSKLLLAAMAHDQGEYLTGDIPSPVKNSVPGLRETLGAVEDHAMMEIHEGVFEELSAWEYLVLKTADNLDGLIKCIEEKRMGNYTIEECGQNYANYLSAKLGDMGDGPMAEMVQLALTEWHWSHK